MRQIDGKYKTSGDITKLDGTTIPDDEPLILFRGHDKLLVKLLKQYKELCQEAGSPARQLELLQEQIDAIEQWQSANQDKLKVPD